MVKSSNGRASNPPATIFATPLAPKRKMSNQDEAVINVHEVEFTEWVPGESYQIGERVITPHRPVTRTAFIYNFVPARVYDAFMARLDEIQALMPALQAAQAGDAETPEGLAKIIASISKEQLLLFQNLQYECVLVVWQNSEPDMDLDRLKRGLKEEPLAEMFNDFFSQFNQQQKRKAEAGENTLNGKTPEKAN